MGSRVRQNAEPHEFPYNETRADTQRPSERRGIRPPTREIRICPRSQDFVQGKLASQAVDIPKTLHVIGQPSRNLVHVHELPHPLPVTLVLGRVVQVIIQHAHPPLRIPVTIANTSSQPFRSHRSIKPRCCSARVRPYLCKDPIDKQNDPTAPIVRIPAHQRALAVVVGHHHTAVTRNQQSTKPRLPATTLISFPQCLFRIDRLRRLAPSTASAFSLVRSPSQRPKKRSSAMTSSPISSFATASLTVIRLPPRREPGPRGDILQDHYTPSRTAAPPRGIRVSQRLRFSAVQAVLSTACMPATPQQKKARS